MSVREQFDDAIVGAGIIGLAHAYHLAKRGRHVVVFEAGQKAAGASVRNFGMLWPVGQPAGERRSLADRSLRIWLEVLQASGLWHDRAGSLHLAYHEDEAQVLWEFMRDSGRESGCRLLDPSQVVERSPAVCRNGLRAGVWSPTEVCVDPREIVGRLPGWLGEQYGVRFHFGCAVTGFVPGTVRAGGGEYQAKNLYVCPGDNLTTLFPAALRELGLVRCKLQMLRTPPMPGTWRLGPMLAAGLTLRHYASFQDCPSLPALKERMAREMPEYDRYGIHVMVSQNGRGELVIGDSHEYGEAIEPFDRPEIDDLILRYLRRFLALDDLPIAARWHGVYVKHPTEPFNAIRPAPCVTLIASLGGAGMTLAFGVAERVVSKQLGEGRDAD